MTEPPKMSLPSPPSVADVPRRLAAVRRRRLLPPPHNPLTIFGLYETPNLVNGLGPNLKARSKIVLDCVLGIWLGMCGGLGFMKPAPMGWGL